MSGEKREFIKGNEAIAYGALKAGLDAYFAYPITPSSEIPETLAKEFGSPAHPKFKTFMQAASELEAINMVIGAASTGAKVMTATSGPGFSLKQEGMSYAAGMELPFLVVNVNRAGPGLGNLGPEQSDYFQATRGGGHGGYRNIVLAPDSVQEMASFPRLGFSLAFKWRNPVVILSDAFLGQLKEDIVFPDIEEDRFDTSDWATTGMQGRERHVLNSLHLEFQAQSNHSEHLMKKFKDIEEIEQRSESYLTEDADVILVAYGISARLGRHVVNELRNEVKVGLFRPITLNPFPSSALRELALSKNRRFLVVELNMGQMVYDVRLATSDTGCRVSPVNKLGGLLPTSMEIAKRVKEEEMIVYV